MLLGLSHRVSEENAVCEDKSHAQQSRCVHLLSLNQQEAQRYKQHLLEAPCKIEVDEAAFQTLSGRTQIFATKEPLQHDVEAPMEVCFGRA